MLFYLPIETLEERYTAQMFRWVRDELDVAGVDYHIVYPPFSPYSIVRGQFLDVYTTIRWKEWQIGEVAGLFEAGLVRNGDKFLVGDLWFPGLESIRYMSELSGIEVEIWGWHYAGRADPHDFVQNLGPWADASEEGYLRCCDGIFVGSNFHKDLLVNYFGLPSEKVHPLGLVWNLADVRRPVKPLSERPKRVIFPHRCAPEKNPEAFYELAAHFVEKGWDFVITSSRKASAADLGFKEACGWRVVTGLSKQEYYDILADSRVFFSAAYQETFGYALQEAITFGVDLVVPNRCSYPEVLENDGRFLYSSKEEAYAMVEVAVENPISPPMKYTVKYHRSARKALEVMGVYSVASDR